MEENRINSVGETADTIGGGENLETPHKRRVRYKGTPQGPIKRNTKNCSRKNTGIPLRRSSAREVHRQVCIFPLW